jgi:uncharacterized protein with HEPN domain
MRKDPKIYLTHIMQSIVLIEKYLDGVSLETFLNSEEKQDLVSRRLEIIGEAVKQLPDDFRKEHPGIPWRDIGDMRNVLIHVYFDLDYTIIWKTATELVPKLKEQIEEILQKENI